MKFKFSSEITHATILSLKQIGYEPIEFYGEWENVVAYLQDEMYGAEARRFFVVMERTGAVVGLLSVGATSNPIYFISCSTQYGHPDEEEVIKEFTETMKIWNAKGFSPAEVWKALGFLEDYSIVVWNAFVNGQLTVKEG